MDSTTACLDFAAIGHQDSWKNITRFVNGLRKPGQERLSDDTVKNIFAFLPPTEVFKVNVRSVTGATINGVYVETFIDPDKLDARFGRHNLAKVLAAVNHVEKMGSKVATLGGFTSIVLEGNLDLLQQRRTSLTTGNTLTAAFIVKGVEEAAELVGIDLQAANLLIIGATGDIGSACATYFAGRVEKLLLCARKQLPLQELVLSLSKKQVSVHGSTNIAEFSRRADVIISVASSAGIRLPKLKSGVLICDAGYPKNLEQSLDDSLDGHLFHGGMGQVSGGFSFSPDYSSSIYEYPAPFTIHGCILEAMILAFEQRWENYSSGKGKITTEKMEEIYSLSLKHGITIAPFFDSAGCWAPLKKLYA